MTKFIKKPLSILLAALMIVSLFAMVPVTASAEVGDFVSKDDYLTFTAVQAGSSVTLKVASGSNLQYSLDGGELIPYTPGTQITLANEGDSVRFRGKNTTFDVANHVSIVGKVACSGNVMSLRLDDDGMSQGLSDSCFAYMFRACTGLTAAPELPETMLAESCYENMFYACTNLTVAPELPATALAPYCYTTMFASCTSLTTAPELPATTLAPYCYQRMFYSCRSLTTAPELPATTLASYCYHFMFAGCSSIKLSETQTAEYSIPYRVPSVGNGTTASSSDLYNMFAGTGGTFRGGTPEINKKYYRPAEKYTVTWLNEDGTTIDTTSVYEGTTPTYDGETPEKAEDENNTYTFSGWTDGTNTYGATDTLPEVTGDITYTATFDATFKGILSGNLRKGLVIDAGTPIRFAMTKTEDSWAILGLQVYLDDVLVKSVQTEQLQPTEPDRYYTTTKKCIVDSYLGSPNSYPRVYHTLRLKSLHTVTWKNEDGTTLETDVDVVAGKTPTYNGADPEKAEDENNTYTFSGWTPEITAVTGDVTYTAQFTPVPKVFAGNSITLDGNINLNFYINTNAIPNYANAESVTATFTWDSKVTESDKHYGDDVVVVELKDLTPDENGWVKAYVPVNAAQMANQIEAKVYVGDGAALNETKSYSVKEYAETIIADESQPETVKTLVKEMLNYGAMAQTVFNDQLTVKPAELANAGLSADDLTAIANEMNNVTSDNIIGAVKAANGDKRGATVEELQEIGEAIGGKWYTTSVIFLDGNTIRHYFDNVNEDPDFAPGTPVQDEYFYYVEKKGIAAADLDTLYQFTIGGKTFSYSVLDYAAAVVNSEMNGNAKNLAKALYLYNQAANAYFAPAPVENEVISSGSIEDFSTLNVGDYIAKGVGYAADNDYKVVLTGGTYGTESRDGIVVRNGDYNFNAGEYGMGTYSYHVPQPNVFIEDYNENEKFYPAVDGVEGNAFVVVAKDNTQKIITIAGANVTQN